MGCVAWYVALAGGCAFVAPYVVLGVRKVLWWMR